MPKTLGKWPSGNELDLLGPIQKKLVIFFQDVQKYKSVSAAARACSMSPQTLNAIIHGHRTPSMATLMKICERMNITLGSLVPGADPENVSGEFEVIPTEDSALTKHCIEMLKRYDQAGLLLREVIELMERRMSKQP